MARKLLAVTVLLTASCAIVGCDDDRNVTTYQQSKESGQATNPLQGRNAPGIPTPRAGALLWDVPEGWREDPTPRSMREATLHVGEGDAHAELIVTRLAGGFGDLGDNINRWRGQIGLPPLEDARNAPQETLETPVGEARLMRMEAEKQASIVVMLPQGDTNLFFRFTGDRKTVLDNEPKLMQMLKSLRQPQ